MRKSFYGRTFCHSASEINFRTLFIREMLWNNPQGQTTFDIFVEEIDTRGLSPCDRR